MKTTLMDMVQATPASKGLEMQKNAHPRSSDSTQNDTGWKETANTFTRALKKQEAAQETVSEKPSQNPTDIKPEKSQSDDAGTPVNKPTEQPRGELTHSDEGIHEDDRTSVLPAEEGRRLEEREGEMSEDALIGAQLMAFNAGAQPTEPSGKTPLKEMAVTGKKEAEMKINTLLSLLSAKTHLKVPKLEQYVSSMRDAGKSAQEILKTLNTVLEQVSDSESKPQLKDFILKVIPLQDKPAETVDEAEKTPAEQPVAVAKTQTAAGEKLSVNTEGAPHEAKQNAPGTVGTDKVKKATVTTTSPQATPPNAQSVQPLAYQIKQVVSGPVSTAKTDKSAVGASPLSEGQMMNNEKGAPQPVQTTKVAPDFSPETQGKNVLNTMGHAVSQPLYQNGQSTQALPDVSSDDSLNLLKGLIDLYRAIEKTATGTPVNQTIPEKGSIRTTQQTVADKTPEESLIQILSNATGVHPKKVESFFNSPVFSSEELEGFIRFTQTEGIEAALKSTLANVKDVFTVQENTLFSTLEFKSVKVKTTMIMDYIQKGFEMKSFAKDLFSGGENILLKYKTKTVTVEKMTVRFVRKPTAATSEKSLNSQQNQSKDLFQKTGTAVQRFIQQSFKDGYESNNRKHTDLNHFQTKINQPLQEKAETVSLNAKSEKMADETPYSATKTPIKNAGSAEQQESESKPLSKREEGDDNTQQQVGKSLKGTAEPSEKNPQPTQARNMEQVYQKIKDMTQLMARQQTRTELATIKLNPPELGKVSLEIVKEGNKISIVMQVETKEAQDILNKNSNILAARLVNSGFELQKVSVHMEKYEEQGENQANQNGQNGSQQQPSDEQNEQTDSEYTYEEGYSFQDLLKGGIEEHAN